MKTAKASAQASADLVVPRARKELQHQSAAGGQNAGQSVHHGGGQFRHGGLVAGSDARELGCDIGEHHGCAVAEAGDGLVEHPGVPDIAHNHGDTGQRGRLDEVHPDQPPARSDALCGDLEPAAGPGPEVEHPVISS